MTHLQLRRGFLVKLPKDTQRLLDQARSIVMPQSPEEIIDLALGDTSLAEYEVAYDIPGKGRVVEAVVHRVRNGLAANYTESYMRRRDPQCMHIADDMPTEKKKYEETFNQDFPSMRAEIMDWLSKQDLVVLPFYAGAKDLNHAGLLIGPRNAAFFAGALAYIQGMVKLEDMDDGAFAPQSIIYLAPPFRHTHCDGKQIVIHQRSEELHEIFSLNLYPGPSAKKGIYGVLIEQGEKEGWICAHASTVRVVTPYDNHVHILHEGASGGGKSEMLEYPHRENDGRLMLGKNTVTDKKRYFTLTQGCTLHPVTDDMALTHLTGKDDSKKLVVTDAEEGWFLRVNHITGYGVDPHIEKMCTNPKVPLVFLNVYSVPEATCLIWEPIEDAPGQPCPNPRVIVPRNIVPDIVDEPVGVDIRSFGVRVPPCTKEVPSYGILGLVHLLPPSLAWLWRLVSPRGFGNPSIVDTGGMSSEGVGSYWPFSTGRRVDQVNLLLKQIIETPQTNYILVPNQHIGAWETGFMPQWIAREFLARRGIAKFRDDQITDARCSLLGSVFEEMEIEGSFVDREFLQVQFQPEVGEEAYDQGAKILNDFFKKELAVYLESDELDPLGRKIIEACIKGSTVAEYKSLI